MNNSWKTMVAVALTLGLSAPATAAEFCGTETTRNNGAAMAQIGNLSARCIPDGKCSISLSSIEDVGISLERASVAGSWLTLVTSSFSVDSGAGFDLIFNEDDETRIPPEFLIAAEDMKSVRVDDDVSDIVMTSMLESDTLRATIQLVGGKRVTHNIALKDLDKATAWVDCAQAK